MTAYCQIKVILWSASYSAFVLYTTTVIHHYSPPPRGSKRGEPGWRSGETARLPVMCPGFDSRTRRHIWIEFVVGFLRCSERFFSEYSGPPLSSNTNISKFDLDYCQTLYHEPLARVTAQALPVLDIEFTIYNFLIVKCKNFM